jgi:hypothetical protein
MAMHRQQLLVHLGLKLCCLQSMHHQQLQVQPVLHIPHLFLNHSLAMT